MYCSNCGKKISEHSIYCPSCGVKLGEVKDRVSDGMQSFSVSGSDSVIQDDSIDWGGLIKFVFILLGILCYNLFFGVVVFFTTPYLIDFVVALDSNTESFSENWWIVLYMITIIIWQYANDKLSGWSDDLRENSFENVDFFTWIFIFIPLVPTVISFYVILQNEYLPITMMNLVVYIFALISCCQYYWIKIID